MPKTTNKTDLTRMNRAAANVRLGSIVEELIDGLNAANATIRDLVTKANAGTGTPSSTGNVDLARLVDRLP